MEFHWQHLMINYWFDGLRKYIFHIPIKEKFHKMRKQINGSCQSARVTHIINVEIHIGIRDDFAIGVYSMGLVFVCHQNCPADRVCKLFRINTIRTLKQRLKLERLSDLKVGSSNSMLVASFPREIVEYTFKKVRTPDSSCCCLTS